MQSQLVKLHDAEWFRRQKVAGATVAQVLKTLGETVKSGVSGLNLLELDLMAEKIILEAGCTPTFHNYHGFPGHICLSVNRAMVHGIPTNYLLQPGDVVKIDLGATYEGAIADAARTVIFGQPRDTKHLDLIAHCQNSLYAGLRAVKLGKRLGNIGQAISRYTRDNCKYALITKYGGHGLDYDKPHASPFVANRAQMNEGVRFQNGMALAIEPMLVNGSDRTKIDSSDGWTVWADGTSAHFEHSLCIWEDQVHVVTQWEEQLELS